MVDQDGVDPSPMLSPMTMNDPNVLLHSKNEVEMESRMMGNYHVRFGKGAYISGNDHTQILQTINRQLNVES